MYYIQHYVNQALNLKKRSKWGDIMIFTTLNENEVIFNEADNKKSKVKTGDRLQLLRLAGRLVKENLGPSIEENATFRLDKEYSRNDFLNNKCEFVTVVHIKKSGEMHIGNQYDNAKSMLNILSDICRSANKKLPDGCELRAKFKGDPNSEEEWDGWNIELTVPKGKTEFIITESNIGGDNMFFNEYTSDIKHKGNHYEVFVNGESIAEVDSIPEGREEIKDYVNTHNLESTLSENKVKEYNDNNDNDREDKPSAKERKEYHKNISKEREKRIDDEILNNFRRHNENESTVESYEFISTNNGGSYIHDALYESYIQSKIDAENRLAFALKESMVITESDYSNIRALQEAKLGEKVKSTWNKFIAFIKGLVAKFMESMTSILLDEKAYLEKYKDIILNKKPKDDMEYSYTGNYKKGIERLISTEVPMFDYYKYKKALEAEGDGELVQAIMQGKQFSYDDGETLPEQFKGYFLALEDGQQQGKFSDLNMTDMYNFCYNFNKIKGIVDKDVNRLEASTKAIESAINKELTASGNAAAGDNVEKQETKTEESAVIREAEEDKAKSTGLKIEDKPSSDPTSKMGSTQNRDNDAEQNAASAGAAVAKNDNKEASDITQAANKWIGVCRPLIAAKLTACQQISKDYMDIIRAHVRSYGGESKKSKEGNKGKDVASKYSKNKDVEKAKADAEKAKKEAEKPESTT